MACLTGRVSRGWLSALFIILTSLGITDEVYSDILSKDVAKYKHNIIHYQYIQRADIA